MGYPPSGREWTITSPSGPGPASSSPHVLTRDEGEDGHVPAGPRPGRDPPRVPTRAAGSQGVTRPQLVAGDSPPGPGPSGSGVHEDQGGSVPRHVEGAVTVEVTAHGVKRIRPAGPVAARGPTRRGEPARRAGRIMPCGR